MSHRYLISYSKSGICSPLEVARHIDVPDAMRRRCMNMGEDAKLVCKRTYRTLADCDAYGRFTWIDTSLTKSAA